MIKIKKNYFLIFKPMLGKLFMSFYQCIFRVEEEKYFDRNIENPGISDLVNMQGQLLKS